MTNHHPTRTLTDPQGEPAEIDVELVPLVQVLWRLGIETVACCQDVGESLARLARAAPHLAAYCERKRGIVSVDFHIDAGLKFLTTIAQAGPRDDFYVRMFHWTAPDAWQARVHVYDLATDEEDRRSEFDLGPFMLVSFPRTDLDEILRRLEAFERGELYPPGPTDWSSVEFDDVDDSA